jgi:hypothetical protein
LNGGKGLGGNTHRERETDRERERGEVAEKETKREVAVRERGK